MNNLFLALMIAFVVIVFAIAILATAWLFTGKKTPKPKEIDKSDHKNKHIKRQ